MSRLLQLVLILELIVCSITQAKPASGKDEDARKYGPAVCHSVTFVKPKSIDERTWEGAVTRSINLVLPEETTVCFDVEHLAVAAIWRGAFLDISKTHLTSYKGQLCPRPGATPSYQQLTQAGWATPAGELKPEQHRFDGYYLHGDKVLLTYTVGQRKVHELPGVSDGSLTRDIEISSGKQAVSMLVAQCEAPAELANHSAFVSAGKHSVGAVIAGDTEGLTFRQAETNLYLDIPASDKPRRFQVRYCIGDATNAAALLKAARPSGQLPDLNQLKQAGPRRWPETFTTAGKLSEAKDAYVLDDLPVPTRPYGAWMRLSAIDFFDDGRAAVATLAGDVWLVSWPANDISQITWQRFATGLYEPLGLKVVDGKIYVRGRDRITRLHDANSDGEADFYENFHAHGPIGPGYHAFIFDLNTDDDGNFWYVNSGRKGPSIGEVIKLSPDGKTFEVAAQHFRHPNGMGIGGPHQWITIADNDDGKYPAGACLVRQGQSYGWNGPRTEPFLYVLPPKVDTSSGSQCWTDPKRFGPLGGALIHTSYSTSSISYVVTQNSQPYPSGFAVHMPYGFKSGPMRLRVSPRDGQMYIACQRGWDSNAAVDGMIHRLRYTGRDCYLVTGAKATEAGVELTFACELDEETVDFDNFFAARVDDKSEEEVDIDDVTLIDKHTALVEFASEDIDPAQIIDRQATKRAKADGDERTHFRVVAPLAITFNMKAADGTPIKETVYCTINGF